MGLLDKTNPRATGASVTRHSIIAGVAAAGVLLFAWSPVEDPRTWLLLILAALFGAFVGGLVEWQLDDSIPMYEVMLEIDEEFAIQLDKEKEFDTVGELLELVLAAQRERDDQAVDEQETWQRLRMLLVEQLGIKPEQVVPTARFYIDIRM